MKRLDRLTAILIYLQTKRVVAAQELANRFSVSLRTIYRDLRTLETAGVPLGAEAGVGYFLTDYHLPPVMFTNPEASALLFGAKLVEHMADQSIGAAFESALCKIKSVLKGNEKDHLEDLAPKILVSDPPGKDVSTAAVLNTIQLSLVQQRVLTLQYSTPYSNPATGTTSDLVTQRDVEPIGLSYFGNRWHLIAWCRLRQDYRNFRTDRITSLSETSRTFSRQNLLSLQTYLSRLRQQENLEQATVWFDKQVVRYAREQRYMYGFVGEEICGDSVRMEFIAPTFDGLSRWLLSYGKAVRVESPAALKVQLQVHAREIQAHYLV